MATLISLPLLGFVLMLQVAIFSNLRILFGTADLVLLAVIAWTLNEKVKNGLVWAAVGGLMVSLISSLPFYPSLIGYILVGVLAELIKRRIWQIPILAMLFVTVVGTILVQIISLAVLQFVGTGLEWIESINLVILPSTLLNLILALPVYLLIGDLVNLVYPAESDS